MHDICIKHGDNKGNGAFSHLIENWKEFLVLG